MRLDRGTLAKIDRQVLSALDHGQGMQLVKVPLSEAVWSTWRRYCDALGVTMGAGIAGLIAHELGTLVNQDQHHEAVFAPEMLTFAYDDAGRMTSKKYGTVTVAQWSYDQYGRLTQTKSRTDTGGLRVTINHTYETKNNPPTVTDKRGRLTETEWTTQGFGHGTDTYSIDYTYDNADRAYQMDLTTGETVTASFNTRSGMPVSLTGTDTYLDGVVWTGQRQFKSGWSRKGRGAKLYHTRIYSATALTLSQIRAGTSANGTQVAQTLMWWTGNGDLTRARDVKNGNQNQCFTYDSVGRLTVAYTTNNTGGCNGSAVAGNGRYHYTYQYEDNGNIDQVTDHLTSTTHQYTYGAGSAGPHAVTMMGSTACGNLPAY